MAITDELRAVAAKTECANGRCEKLYRGDLDCIADNIDAEHAEAQRRWMAELDAARDKDGYIELPKDADGEYIHIGDKVTCGANVWEVTGFRLAGGGWGICCTIFFDQGGSGTNVYPPSELHHYHASTVEDVLRDMHMELNEVTALYVGEAIDSDERDHDVSRIFAEYAKRLRLAESEES